MPPTKCRDVRLSNPNIGLTIFSGAASDRSLNSLCSQNTYSCSRQQSQILRMDADSLLFGVGRNASEWLEHTNDSALGTDDFAATGALDGDA